MDGPLIAANTAAHVSASRSAQIATDFLRDVPAAQRELEPLLIELFEVRGTLERLQDVILPVPLFAPLVGVIRGCTDVCSRIDGVLSQCGDGSLRSGRWAVTEASVEIQGLSRVLGFCRRTAQLTFEAVDLKSNQPTLADIEHLRQQLTTGSLQLSRLGVLLGSCLDEVENLIVDSSNTSVQLETRSNLPLANSPTTPSVQSMMVSFRKLAGGSKSSKHARPSSITSPELESVSEGPAHSPSLATIPDEQLFHEPDPEIKDTKPSDSPLTQRRSSIKDARPSPAYSLFPTPPPARSLPPLPPPKSHLRQKPLTPPASLAPHLPVKSRARAFSDNTRDSKFSTLSEAASNRYSASSSLSQTKFPPRSSSYADTYQLSLPSLKHTTSTASEDIGVDVTPLRRLDPIDKDSAYGVYSIITSPTSANLASRHGKSCINIWDIQSGYILISTIKVPFYVQAQPRSRENFIRSHAILSEALNLIAITSAFGHTLEIWNWARRKKVQSINDAYRWAHARQPQAGPYPLAAYRADTDTIDLYPASPPSTTSKKPFGKPRSIHLKKAGLPHLPKFPELAYSATGPLLVAAAGPRPPRPDSPPAEHAALLMAPYKFLMPDRHKYPELEDSLPLCLATYGSVAVSIWSPARFRTIGRPGAWQVEPVVVKERVVLVWDFGGAGEGEEVRQRTLLKMDDNTNKPIVIAPGESANERPPNLMDLPTELHLEIVEYCLLVRAFRDRWTPKDSKLIGGAVRDLTLVNRYFRQLTASYLFKSICINDKSEATCQDLLLSSMKRMHKVSTSLLLKKTQKFTISIGRTPQPNRAFVEKEFISTLDYIRPPTQRFVIEKETTPWPFLQKVRKIWNQWQSNGMPHYILNTKQLELSAPWGHRFDFQFLTHPYIHMERLWLDFDLKWLRPHSLNLSKFAHLQYVMIRAHPHGPLLNNFDLGYEGFNEQSGKPLLGQLAQTLPHLKHLAMYGLLNGPIRNIASLLRPMKSLEQLDITDQQPVSSQQVTDVREMLHPYERIDKAMCNSKLIREHPANVDRVEAATLFFTAIPSLDRICFVRDQVGTMYHAVRDEKNKDRVLERVEEGETIVEKYRYLTMNHDQVWRCGFPNVLGYSLFEPAALACHSSTLLSEKAFWMRQEYLDGDLSVVPEEFEWKLCLWKAFGHTE
ncbi:hypothetical protein VMCG_04024 [Cytospora schulzeri]|uniref:Uncharacterized protein n=1 Tax=Cytospora schulzeri TaxID=448051 RepID=A0A423WT77_9PEZI|nr:hypothetical protein VMCG_04024 [Valsa malicola]